MYRCEPKQIQSNMLWIGRQICIVTWRMLLLLLLSMANVSVMSVCD